MGIGTKKMIIECAGVNFADRQREEFARTIKGLRLGLRLSLPIWVGILWALWGIAERMQK